MFIYITVIFIIAQNLVGNSVKESQENMKSAAQLYVLLESLTYTIFSCHNCRHVLMEL